MDELTSQRIDRLDPGRQQLLGRRLAEATGNHTSHGHHARLVAFIRQGTTDPPVTARDYRAYAAGLLPAYMVPAIVRVLETFPLTPNGKVDRRALANTLLASDDPPAAAPSSLSTQAQTLLAIWKKYLGRADLGAEDNFFEMGGDSLLAIQMINEAARNGIQIQVSEFFNTPMISALVASCPDDKEVEPGEVQEIQDAAPVPPVSGLICPLRTTGTLPPLFLIHEIASTIFMYRELTRYLPPEQPVYAIQPSSLKFNSIGEMATRYLGEVRRIVGSGPFHLGGYCFGGHVAFEMARQEAENGNSPPYIVIIDGIFMNLVRYRPKYLWGFLKRQTPGSIAGRVRVKSADLSRRLSRYLRGSGFKDEAPDRYDISSLPDGLKELMILNYRAQRDFRPKRHFGDMTLITTPSIYSEIDPYTGWDRIVKGNISVHCVDADHGSIMKEPHIGKTGACISRDLLKFADRPPR